MSVARQAAAALPAVDLADVQGLVRFGHGHLSEAVFLLLKVADAAAAGTWLQTAPVTNAATADHPPEVALQAAFTRQGLEALGVPPGVIRGFSDEFLAGMAGEESRSRRLGDIGADAPSSWRWGGRNDAVPHLVLLLYAKPGGLDAWKASIVGDPDFARAFAIQAELPTDDIGDIEPFGFADGLSQPRLDWQRELKQDRKDRLYYSNILALGEVLLGYPNEYGYYTQRPLIDPNEDSRAAALPSAEEEPALRDLARNGTYLVVRDLQQDVRGFWQFVDRQAGHDPERRWRLAAAMVGRTPEGKPLVSRSREGIPGVGPAAKDIAANQFTYADDPDGIGCPIGAHVRRANPRTPDLPGGEGGLLSRLVRIAGFNKRALDQDLVASTRFHRILRRGREYGSRLPADEALRPVDGDDERGLRFVCLVANIGRQFEFVQNAWVQGAKFAGLPGEGDPLLGHREPLADGRPTDRLSLPQAQGLPERIEGLPRFVTVRGGGYFFLPGLRALHYIARCAT
jgi:deferrochelatase/peroxidase EfeB